MAAVLTQHAAGPRSRAVNSSRTLLL